MNLENLLSRPAFTAAARIAALSATAALFLCGCNLNDPDVLVSPDAGGDAVSTDDGATGDTQPSDVDETMDAADADTCLGSECGGSDADSDATDATGDDTNDTDAVDPVDEDSPYAIAVDLPECDSSNPQVEFITSRSGVDEIGRSDALVYCIAPGDYRSANRVEIKQHRDGEKRVLRLFDPSSPDDDTHPSMQQEADRAILHSLALNEADNWIFDRITVRPGDGDEAVTLDSSNSNVFNRMLIEDSTQTLVEVRRDSNANVIQKSVLRRAREPGEDANCVSLRTLRTGAVVSDTRVVDNELYDCTDGVALVADALSQGSTYPGTIIAHNDIYVSDAYRTDCDGNLVAGGDCACSENAVDIKAGSTAAAAPVEVIENRIWGFRTADSACNGDRGGGGAILIHKGDTTTEPANYVSLEGNLVFESQNAITLAWGASFLSIFDNVFHSTGSAVGADIPTIVTGGNDAVELYRNTFVDVTPQWAGLNDTGRWDIRCNVLLSSGWAAIAAEESQGLMADYNAYYDTTQAAVAGSEDIVRSDRSEADHEELCFTTRRWTGATQVCLPDVQPTTASPHYDHCDPNLGSVAGVGVDDQPY